MLQPRLITSRRELLALEQELRRVRWLGVDVEANGLFAYAPRLCTVQLSWPIATAAADDEVAVAIIDSLATSVQPLAALLGSEGPIKILHDLTFDARMLQEHDIVLGTVRDTSVAARFLGEPNTGLSALLATHCNVELAKGLQNHDWAKRPLQGRQLDYLADDVRYLRQLDRALAKRSSQLDIELEIATECSYKLARALEPPQDTRPTYLRIKGYDTLRGRQRSILRQLVDTRDRIAVEHDVPAHHVLSSGSLIELARTTPKNHAGVERLCRTPLARRHVEPLLAAIRRGREDEDDDDSLPSSPRPPSPSAGAQLKRLSSMLSRWRKREAAARNVDVQVVMPGHCMTPLANALAASADRPRAELATRLAAVEGICGGRIERYADELHRLASRAPSSDDELRSSEERDSRR